MIDMCAFFEYTTDVSRGKMVTIQRKNLPASCLFLLGYSPFFLVLAVPGSYDYRTSEVIGSELESLPGEHHSDWLSNHEQNYYSLKGNYDSRRPRSALEDKTSSLDEEWNVERRTYGAKGKWAPRRKRKFERSVDPESMDVTPESVQKRMEMEKEKAMEVKKEEEDTNVTKNVKLRIKPIKIDLSSITESREETSKDNEMDDEKKNSEEENTFGRKKTSDLLGMQQLLQGVPDIVKLRNLPMDDALSWDSIKKIDPLGILQGIMNPLHYGVKKESNVSNDSNVSNESNGNNVSNISNGSNGSNGNNVSNGSNGSNVSNGSNGSTERVEIQIPAENNVKQEKKGENRMDDKVLKLEGVNDANGNNTSVENSDFSDDYRDDDNGNDSDDDSDVDSVDRSARKEVKNEEKDEKVAAATIAAMEILKMLYDIFLANNNRTGYSSRATTLFYPWGALTSNQYMKKVTKQDGPFLKHTTKKVNSNFSLFFSSEPNPLNHLKNVNPETVETNHPIITDIKEQSERMVPIEQPPMYTSQSVIASTSRAVEASTKEPVEMITSHPVEMVTNKPVEMYTSKPIEMHTIKPVEVYTSKPAEMAISHPLETSTRNEYDRSLYKYFQNLKKPTKENVNRKTYHQKPRNRITLLTKTSNMNHRLIFVGRNPKLYLIWH